MSGSMRSFSSNSVSMSRCAVGSSNSRMRRESSRSARASAMRCSLAARQRAGALAHQRVQPVRQLGHEIAQPHDLHRARNLIGRSASGR